MAKRIVIEVATDLLSEYSANSRSKWKSVVNKYYIEDAQMAPTLAISLTDNWIQFNLRYIVDCKKRRLTKHLLSDNIQKEIQKTSGKVILASSTLELVKLPEIKIDLKDKPLQ